MFALLAGATRSVAVTPHPFADHHVSLCSARSLGRTAMIRTITLGSCVSIQGHFEKTLPDGRVCVRVGDKLYVGRLVKPIAQAA